MANFEKRGQMFKVIPFEQVKRVEVKNATVKFFHVFGKCNKFCFKKLEGIL